MILKRQAREGVGRPKAAAGSFPYPHAPLGRRVSGAHGAPADLSINAAKMTLTQLAEHYGCARQTAARWINGAGINAQKREAPNKLPLPADLAERAAEKCRADLARHYGVDFNTVGRWLATAGIVALRFARQVSAPKPVQRRCIPPSQLRGYAGPKSAFTGLLSRDLSTEGEAADLLRRETRASIYRATETGRADPKGSHWRYGNVVLTGEELVERAKRKGFDPDAWRRLPSIPPSQRQGLAQQQGAGA